MRDYLVSLLLVSAVTAVLGLLPSEEKMRRTVGFVLSLAVLSAVALPLPALLSELPREYEGILDRLDGASAEGSDYLTAETLSAVAEGISAHLAERYGLPREEITAEAFGEIVGDTLILRRVTLTLGPRAAMADVPSIVKYIEANTAAECEVYYRES